MASKAEFRGTCQCCGAVQKLPGSVLSKHGYTTKWGFFEGICAGTGFPPFEESCALVETFIRSAQQKRDHLLSLQEKLRVPTTSNVGWKHVYRTWGRLSGTYYWTEVRVVMHVKPFADGTGEHKEFTYEMLEGTERPHFPRLDFYGKYPQSEAEAATLMNATRADALNADIRNIDQYIQWQTERVQTWTPQSLLPLEGSPNQSVELAAE